MSRHTTHGLTLFVVLLAALTLWGCNDENSSPTPGGPIPPTNHMTGGGGKEAPEGAVTYHRDVRPLFDRHCSSCHGVRELGDFSVVHEEKQWGIRAPDWISTAIEKVRTEGSHWAVHDDSCGSTLLQPRALNEDEIFTLAKWETDGKWEGNPTDYVPGSALFDRPAEAPFITRTTPAYLPDDVEARDHRCFIFEETFEADTFINALELTPGNASLVNHITLVAVNEPRESTPLLMLDRDNQEPGFECFGQFGAAQQTKILHAWSPGSPQGLRLPAQHAFVIPKDARLAVQVHYDPTSLTREQLQEQEEDITSVKLWRGSQPDTEVRILPFANLRIELPANQSDYENTFEFKMPYDLEVIGITPHMLTLATSYTLEAIAMDAGASPAPQCLLELSSWNMSDRQSYQLAPDAHIALKQGDLLRQTCRYDNSAANQPIIDGRQRPSEIVYWGTELGDEMCLSNLLVGVPYRSDTRKVDCSYVEECIEACPVNDLTCFNLCATQSSGDCTDCAYRELINCGGSKCGDVGRQIGICLQVCDLSIGYGTFCIERNCAFEWQEFSNCGVEQFNAGKCTLDNCR